MTALAKGKTRGELKAIRDRIAKTLDRKENEKVKQRSEGRCEVYVYDDETATLRQCARRATQVHHMMGKWRQRGRGASALAEHKQAVCAWCHADITEHRLQRYGRPIPCWKDTYRRVDTRRRQEQD